MLSISPSIIPQRRLSLSVFVIQLSVYHKQLLTAFRFHCFPLDGLSLCILAAAKDTDTKQKNHISPCFQLSHSLLPYYCIFSHSEERAVAEYLPYELPHIHDSVSSRRCHRDICYQHIPLHKAAAAHIPMQIVYPITAA